MSNNIWQSEKPSAGNTVVTTIIDDDNVVPSAGAVVDYVSASGGGDMSKVTYDPTNIASDAFDMANMYESASNKIFTLTERNKLAGIEANANNFALISGTNIKTINSTSIVGSGNIDISAETTETIKTKLGTADTDSDGYLTSTDWNTFNSKQATLVSGTNIKTINSTSLLGSGDITLSGGAVDSVNTQIGTVVLDADDISDVSTTNKFTNTTEKTNIANSHSIATEALTVNGFINPENITVSFANGTRTFTITPSTSFTYYSDGIKYSKTIAENIIISNTEGMHYIYYNGSTLSETTTFAETLITHKAIIAVIYWDVTNQKQIYFGREYFHTPKMGGKTHAYHHQTSGYVLESGGELANILVDQNGSLDSHAQVGNAATVAWDEDAKFTLNARSSTSIMPIYYRSGADVSNIWRINETTTFPILTTGTGRAAYNQLSGGNWLLTEIPDNLFTLAHIAATNDIDRPFIAILNQTYYTSNTLARDAAEITANSIIVSGLPFAEFKFLGVLIFQTRNTYTNTIKSRTISTNSGASYIDLRQTVIGRFGSSSIVTDHNALANIQFASTNGIINGHITNTEYNNKQNLLVSGTNIKTINSTSLLGSGDIIAGDVTGQSSSVDSEIALFSGTGGKTIKRASTTGILKATSGVLSAATVRTDYAEPTTALATGLLKNTTTTGEHSIASAGTDYVSPTGSDGQLSRQMLIDCGYTFIDKGNSGTTTQTLDYTAGSHQKITATGTFTIALSNFPPSGNLGEMLLELVNGGSQTITFPTINWIKPDGTTTTSISTYLAANTGRTALQTSGTDFIVLWSRDGGTTVYGRLV